jgi:LacI family transcriptional regulator
MAQARRKAVTIKDVARAAGVSTTTVSNVLNGRVDSMSAETLQRITEVIQELNYRPNAWARSLVTRRTATIGVVIAEIETPLFVHALNTIEPIARSAGYTVLMGNARDPQEEREVFHVLLEKRVDGLIFLSVSELAETDYIPELERLHVPTVLVNRARTYDHLDQINWDDTTGVIEAMEHLIGLGHRRIAHLCGPPSRRSGSNRLQGYKAALERHHIPYREGYVCPGDYTLSPADWHTSTCRLLELTPRPTAIMASDDSVAAMAIKAIQQAGLRVPEDIAVIGIDDQHFCTLLNPALTTVRLPVLEAGKQAIEMVLARISSPSLGETGISSGEAGSAREHIVLPCSLIVRESSGTRLVE